MSVCTVQTGTRKVDPAQKLKCTTAKILSPVPFSIKRKKNNESKYFLKTLKATKLLEEFNDVKSKINIRI